jgi:hypothetical protein
MAMATAWGCGETQDGPPVGDAAPDTAHHVDARAGQDARPRDAVSTPDGRRADSASAHDASSDATPHDSTSSDTEVAHDATALDAEAGGCSAGVAGVTCLATVGSAYIYEYIAVDDHDVYLVELGATEADTAIVRVPRVGGSSVIVAQAAPALPPASDGTNLYWGSRGADGGSIFQVPLAGGAVTTLAPAVYPQCLTVDETSVYWTDVTSSGFGVVVKVPKGGGSPTTLATGTDRFPSYLPIAVDSTNVYWVDQSVMKVAKTGGSIVTVAGGGTQSSGSFDVGCRLFAVIGNSLLVTGSPTGATGSPAIQSVPVSGAASPTVIASGEYPQVLVAGATNLFWVGLGTQLDVNETSLDGGATTTLASPSAPYVADMAVASDGTLYWITNAQVQSLKP